MIRKSRLSILLICLLGLFTVTRIFAQTISSKRCFIIGAGLQENFYAGFQFPLGDKFYLETAVGFNPVTLRSQKYAMVYAAPGLSLVDYKNGRKVEPFFHLKTMIWYYEDGYNRYFVLGILPEFRLAWLIKRRLNIALTGGVMYNTVLGFTEKSTGFPAKPRVIEPSISVQFCYRLLK